MIFFTKMHGLGNDYIVINKMNNKNKISDSNLPQITRYMCNRHFGIGADGVILIDKSNEADFKMNIYNSDGSKAEMCGNGIRCCTKYIHDNELTQKREIKIETLVGIRTTYIKTYNGIDEITVNMGKPIMIGETNIEIENQKIKLYNVSMGNPHAICFVNDIENINIEKYGSIIEKDNHYPQRTNVEFVKIVDKSIIKMRVWERGVGETFACGTGACAVSAICSKLGKTRRTTRVILKGRRIKNKLG